MEIDFNEITLREKISGRGGGVEIDLTSLGYKGKKMVAIQNYLGGGMLGRVVHTHDVDEKDVDDRLREIGMKLREYYFNLTNPPEERWESMSFEQNQKMTINPY